jgi:methylenetetrahydrofolate dehydrogenase (NADP+)/methenyltetrahydrofolate cyclohydrolase
MTARIINGKAIAAKLSQNVADAVKRVTEEHGIEPGLAVALVGDNPARTAGESPPSEHCEAS